METKLHSQRECFPGRDWQLRAVPVKNTNTGRQLPNLMKESLSKPTVSGDARLEKTFCFHSPSRARAERTGDARRGQGSTYSVVGLSAKSSASWIKPGQFAPAQYQQVRRQAAVPMDPIANRDRVRLKHVFSRFGLRVHAIMSVYRTCGVKTQHCPVRDANPTVRHHAQYQCAG
jgi:hypothetical protein